ncbi:hypothetical protein GCM10009765_45430 [Fodinicola feengrottensis]|uniref:Cell envelope-related transcriptional attenuator domain-containing protein n=1 Tax=Fodinicola feengrottensis TaxID=435914 RepID=A0ABN2HNM5_9ACTN
MTKRTWRRNLLAMTPLTLLLVAAALVPVTAVMFRDIVAGELAGRYASMVNRADLLPESDTKPADVTGPMTILMLGSDNYDGTRGYQGVTGQRSDSVILVHADRDFQHVSAVSIQRDSYVYVPAAGPWHGGNTKINAALAYGGATLSVQVVEKQFGIHIDHVMVMSFRGLHTATDAVGGVDVTIDKAVYDTAMRVHWPAGVNHLDGKAAEMYVRDRYGLPQGDFDRMKRHQQFLHALMTKGIQLGMAGDLKRLDQAVSDVAKATTVDPGMPVQALAEAMVKLSPSAVTYGSMFNDGGMTIDGHSFQRVDPKWSQALGTAIKSDDFGPYWKIYPPNTPTHGA